VSKKDTDKVRSLLQDAKRSETTVRLCLRGDIQAQIDELERQMMDLKDAGLPSLGDSPEAKPIAEQIKALEQEAKDYTLAVTFRALPRRQWQDLVAKHPGKTDDYVFDVAIWNEAIPACWVEPELDRETIDKLLDDLSQGQYDELAQAVGDLNLGGSRVPFSALASAALRNSGETSKKPAGSA
jgi:phage host-nuclease inhibitor protein Gam